MRFVCLDFESYFADDFTLSKMTTESYIRDPRFIAHGAAVKWSANHDAKWYDEPELRFVLAQEDWSDVFMIHHHAQFDGLILSHHYDVHPKMFGDTLAMARLLIGNHISVSLESVRKHFGIPPKTTPYNLFKNKHWNELTQHERSLVADGACDEVESIWKIFNILLKDMPREEIEIVDITTKMFTEPCLRADLPMLAQVWTSENDNKAKRLADLNVATADLQSADRFAALLRACGVEPETKESTKGNVIYAFAKTDEWMRDLLEHPNERVRTLAEARIGAKSTLLQTRAETLGFSGRRGALPVYLRYCGAHTTRWSGGDGCLTADTKVIIYDWQKGLTEKRIVDILLDDLVWDGEEFVTHGGVAFRGFQEVITHDGITGTTEHVIFSRKGEISLARAHEKRTRILDCPAPTDRDVGIAARSEHYPYSMPLQMRNREGG